MKVDSNSRNKAFELIERLERNEISSFELEDEWPKSKDPALNGIHRWLWISYSDNSNEKVYELLSDKDKVLLRNCKSFLSSSDEFPMRKLSLLGKLREKLKWGIEWNVECTLPESEYWPLSKEGKPNQQP